MSINNSIFQTEDDLWYFWLGDGLKGPFYEYTDAHLELSKLLKEQYDKKES